MSHNPVPFNNAKGFKILLVEDNSDDETLTLEVFKTYPAQIDISVVRDGKEALDYLFYQGVFSERTPKWEPSLIIMDLKIPKVPGIEVIKQIRKNPLTQIIPIVIFSSSLEDKDIYEGYMAGANSYIRKPVDFKIFTQAINQVLNYWLAFNETHSKHYENKF